MKYIALKIEIMIGLNKIGEAIEFTTKIQNYYIENPEFLYWRGKLMIYNANLDKGKQFLRMALSNDPDNQKVKQAWKAV